MGLLPSVQRRLFADLCGEELPIRYSGGLAFGAGSGDSSVVGLPPYHHPFLVAQEAGLIAEAVQDNFPENYGKVKISA